MSNPTSTSRFYDIAVVMITIDRTPFGKENYLPQTLANLRRSGLWGSPRLHSFHLVDGGSRVGWAQDIVSEAGGMFSIEPFIHTSPSSSRLLACENAGRALILGSLTSAPWVLFCEDDIDVCARFLDSVGVWLDVHGHGSHNDHYRLFAFGAAYDQTLQAYRRNLDSWDYPVSAFYGTQCFAVRSKDAASLGQYISTNPPINGTARNPNAYDLMIHAWANLTYPGCSFLASAPNFVEHIGRQSICTGRDETHRFPSWQGREWTYERVGL
jgi:hypothetical protein